MSMVGNWFPVSLTDRTRICKAIKRGIEPASSDAISEIIEKSSEWIDKQINSADIDPDIERDDIRHDCFLALIETAKERSPVYARNVLPRVVIQVVDAAKASVSHRVDTRSDRLKTLSFTVNMTDKFERDEAKYVIDLAMRSLSDNDQRRADVVRRRWFEDDRLEDIAQDIDLTRERVRQLEASGMQRMADTISRMGFDPDTMTFDKRFKKESPFVCQIFIAVAFVIGTFSIAYSSMVDSLAEISGSTQTQQVQS